MTREAIPSEWNDSRSVWGRNESGGESVDDGNWVDERVFLLVKIFFVFFPDGRNNRAIIRIAGVIAQSKWSVVWTEESLILRIVSVATGVTVGGSRRSGMRLEGEEKTVGH